MYSFMRSELWRHGREKFAKFRLFKTDGRTFICPSKENAFYKERANCKTTFVAIVKLE